MVDNLFILTIELAENAVVGAVVVVTDIMVSPDLQYETFSDFRVFVGGDADNYEANTECEGGPFLDYSTPSLLSHWPFGAEVWCNL